MIVSRDGSSAFYIHDSFIDVTIPFDREVMALMLALMMALFRVSFVKNCTRNSLLAEDLLFRRSASALRSFLP